MKKIIKKLVCITIAFNAMVSLCCVNVKAEVVVSEEKNIEIMDEQEALIRELDEQYMELEIELPEAEYVCVEKVKSRALTRSLPNYSSICYTNGTATNTDIADCADDIDDMYYNMYNETDNRWVRYSLGAYTGSSIIIPGMENTNVAGQNCDDMVPQGITYYNGYFFITAYCSEKEHNSVVYVIDGSTKNYITTLVLRDKPHAGGITFAYGYMWVAATSKIQYYNCSEIERLISYIKSRPSIKSAKIDGIGKYMTVDKTTSGYGEVSFLTTCKGYLCVGSYQKENESKGYLRFCTPIPSENGNLVSNYKIEIPYYAQGVEYYKQGSIEHFIITVSGSTFGRAYVYNAGKSGERYVLAHTKTIELPPLAEEVVTANGYTYFLFESCCREYSAGIKDLLLNVVGEACGMSNSIVYNTISYK